MTTATKSINGLNVDTLHNLVKDVSRDPATGIAKFHVKTGWTGGTRSESRVDHWEFGGRREPRNFSIRTDEPPALLGASKDANPQEVLMAAINACMLVGYVAGCSLKGIEVESLEIETRGQLDLRGFLALDPAVKPGYEELACTVRIKSNGSPEQLREVHEMVQRTSPNFWNITQAVRVRPQLLTA